MSTRALVSPDISRRFDVLRTLLVAFIIGVHVEKGVQAYYAVVPDGLRAWLALVNHNLYRLCVPVFFSISGYLFYLTYKPTAAAYGRMVVKKTKTILLPYLFFNALTIALILLFNKVPYIGDINDLRADGIAKYLLGVYRFPAVYTLWFLRDLYVYFLLAPVFYVVSEEIPLLGLPLFWAIWMFVPQAGLPVELSGLFFFYAGCLLSRTRADLDAARRLTVSVAALYGVMALATAHVEFHYGFAPLYHLLYRNTLICGTFALWLLTGYSWLGRSKLLLGLSGVSFFVYLTHEPVLSYLIYGTRFLFHPSGTADGIAYMLLLLLVTFALCTGLARLCIRFVPTAYALVTGSRLPR
ncbi:acyltransferase 3 [Solidesulfovibrio carbinoliphilus subsp. oakridgensis]|uniref:Acyltransferase 3 n=1 Tax=Solidesulfovibrio carbinoliphilus subsp. oakridgensis TaxID=694327 RepID=G7Q3Y9_9BACT|nr:acyltransferase [Solidesulfovibrio carbinoliphilus]EHJ46779.1 acyltransferase 3 [Solidesulfovibrio carbinoliphilus subsp. oakridgensis]